MAPTTVPPASLEEQLEASLRRAFENIPEPDDLVQFVDADPYLKAASWPIRDATRRAFDNALNSGENETREEVQARVGMGMLDLLLGPYDPNDVHSYRYSYEQEPGKLSVCGGYSQDMETGEFGNWIDGEWIPIDPRTEAKMTSLRPRGLLENCVPGSIWPFIRLNSGKMVMESVALGIQDHNWEGPPLVVGNQENSHGTVRAIEAVLTSPLRLQRTITSKAGAKRVEAYLRSPTRTEGITKFAGRAGCSVRTLRTLRSTGTAQRDIWQGVAEAMNTPLETLIAEDESGQRSGNLAAT